MFLSFVLVSAVRKFFNISELHTQQYFYLGMYDNNLFSDNCKIMLTEYFCNDLSFFENQNEQKFELSNKNLVFKGRDFLNRFTNKKIKIIKRKSEKLLNDSLDVAKKLDDFIKIHKNIFSKILCDKKQTMYQIEAYIYDVKGRQIAHMISPYFLLNKKNEIYNLQIRDKSQWNVVKNIQFFCEPKQQVDDSLSEFVDEKGDKNSCANKNEEVSHKNTQEGLNSKTRTRNNLSRIHFQKNNEDEATETKNTSTPDRNLYYPVDYIFATASENNTTPILDNQKNINIQEEEISDEGVAENNPPPEDDENKNNRIPQNEKRFYNNFNCFILIFICGATVVIIFIIKKIKQ
ncbi:putative SP-containing membrane protein [Vairimorpha necatrix]|uniref:SP-containing membrane protein n=1 Tax=Vairimorpha necatrix TaxID=6039 RepID=A0AAX4JDQ7_9MICR